MAVGCPVTFTGRELPVVRGIRSDLDRVGVLCLEDDQRGDCSTGSTNALDGVIYSCRPATTLQFAFSLTLTDALED